MKNNLQILLEKRAKNKYNILHFRELESTNIYLKALASSGAPDKTVAIADMQTGGMGQHGRKFFSPEGDGIYFSILLREGLNFEKIELMTLWVGVACRRAILKCTGLETKLKWVNDILCNGKKLTGILCESKILSNGEIEYVVIGIGINCHTMNFPPELEEIATSIDICGGRSYTRDELMAEIITELEMIFAEPENALAEYRSYCKTLGETIEFVEDGKAVKAMAIDIGNRGELIVRYENGAVGTRLSR